MSFSIASNSVFKLSTATIAEVAFTSLSNSDFSGSFIVDVTAAEVAARLDDLTEDEADATDVTDATSEEIKEVVSDVTTEETGEVTVEEEVSISDDTLAEFVGSLVQPAIRTATTAKRHNNFSNLIIISPQNIIVNIC